MADRPILYSRPMVHAQQRGRKTQTRRPLKSLRGFGAIREFGRSDTVGYDWHFRDSEARWNDLRHRELLKALRFAVGDRLWVRENWRPDDYAPDETIYQGDIPAGVLADAGDIVKWKPSIHLPRKRSRLTDIVTDVRVERLQDISEDDAKAEGVVWSDEWRGFIVPGVPHPDRNFPVLSRATAREMYAALWDVINGSGAWLANPWVIATTFTVEKRNIDALDRQETA